MIRCKALLCAAAVVLPALPLHAQTPSRGPLGDTVLHRAADQRWLVRTTLADGHALEGRVREIVGDSVVLYWQPGFRIDQLATIDRGSRDNSGTTMGAVLGAAAGA